MVGRVASTAPGNIDVILADFPWRYRNRHTGGSLSSGSADHYPVMSLDEMCKIRIPCSPNAVLFLWSPVPLLPDALKLMTALGFKYKTKIVWVKTGRLGMGYWFRCQHEDLLVGVKGKVPAFHCQHRNVVYAPGGPKHSSKPTEIHRLIEEATAPLRPARYIELFARQRRPGWICMGYEIDGRDIRDSLKDLEI